MSALYDACVNVMIHAANALGVTYRDINAALLLVIFPSVTLACFALAVLPYGRWRRRPAVPARGAGSGRSGGA